MTFPNHCVLQDCYYCTDRTGNALPDAPAASIVLPIFFSSFDSFRSVRISKIVVRIDLLHG